MQSVGCVSFFVQKYKKCYVKYPQIHVNDFLQAL